MKLKSISNFIFFLIFFYLGCNKEHLEDLEKKKALREQADKIFMTLNLDNKSLSKYTAFAAAFSSFAITAHQYDSEIKNLSGNVDAITLFAPICAAVAEKILNSAREALNQDKHSSYNNNCKYQVLAIEHFVNQSNFVLRLKINPEMIKVKNFYDDNDELIQMITKSLKQKAQNKIFEDIKKYEQELQIHERNKKEEEVNKIYCIIKAAKSAYQYIQMNKVLR